MDLCLLCLQLLGVGQGLPFASAADTEVLASRLYPYGAPLYEVYGTRLTVLMLLFGDLQVYYIAGDDERHKDDLVVDVCHAFSLGGNALYLYILV